MRKPLFKPYHRHRTARSWEGYRKMRLAKGKSLGLHMGCGDRPIAGWFNCDVARIGDSVNYVDATVRMPFEDGELDYVFSEHFIEHLSLEQGMAFFQECFRVLKPGGVLRTATPSLAFVRDLVDLRTPEHGRYVEWCVSNFLPGRPIEPATVVNHLFYGWGHRFIYDSRMLGRSLEKIGFRGLRDELPGKSSHSDLSGLEQHGNSVPTEFNELETFVLEASKEAVPGNGLQ